MIISQNRPQVPVPTLGRMMVFVDGENLIFRYQKMLDEGATPNDGVTHQPDAFVWRWGTVKPGLNVIARATYYMYVTGDEQRIQEIKQRIRELTFQQYHRPELRLGGILRNLYPRVFHKIRRRKAKGLDIQMTVDILSNLYEDNLDVAYLVTGDGDYFPVIEEIIRKGKQAFVAALSDGLNEELVNRADKFINLDPVYFKQVSPKSDPPKIECDEKEK